jgi:murein DD-endopeptidase MepM/ murein hydrolase activator NlpD
MQQAELHLERRLTLPRGPCMIATFVIRYGVRETLLPSGYTQTLPSSQKTAMARPKWTLMLVPHDNDRVRSIHVTGRGVRAVVASSLLLLLLFATVSVGFFLKQSQEIRAEMLSRENRLLAAEVKGMRDSMRVLNTSIETLAQKDEKFRVIAGLDGLDGDLQRVGIGGPGTSTLESAELYTMNPEVGHEVFATSTDLGTLLRRARLLNASMDEAIHTLREHTERLDATPSIAPSSGVLSSLFSRNRRHPVLRITRPHNGIDIAAPVGEPIIAPAAGTVRFAGWKSGGYGNTVEIDHGHGYVTRFAHASKVLVRAGQQVRRGDTIAEVGATGLVSGPHLHYEVEVNGRQVDPLNFIIEDALPQ